GIYYECDDHDTETIAECQVALALDQRYALAQLLVVGVYLKQAMFDEAGAALQKYADLTPPDSAKHAGAVAQVAECKRLASAELLVPAVHAGTEHPDQGVLDELASICYQKRRYADALQLYRQMIAAYPDAAKDPLGEVRHHAACAAVRAASDMTGTAESAA